MGGICPSFLLEIFRSPRGLRVIVIWFAENSTSIFLEGSKPAVSKYLPSIQMRGAFLFWPMVVVEYLGKALMLWRTSWLIVAIWCTQN
ncbi:MAG TPA: hypothetical protein DC054_09320 [Blastocatellia bacterium]|nr:hypothetical protein [Blastocatellia bacterium]